MDAELKERDDCLRDCTILADDLSKVRVNKRFIEAHSDVLAARIVEDKKWDGPMPRYILQTDSPFKTIKGVIDCLENGKPECEDWTGLEAIIMQAHAWKIDGVTSQVISKCVEGITDENCIAVWLLCKQFASDKTAQVFDHMLYVICDAANNGRNLDFYRLDADQLEQVLSADLLNVSQEFDVWLLLKRWILTEKKKRIVHLERLLQCIRFNLFSEKQKIDFKEDMRRCELNIIKEDAIKWLDKRSYRIPRDLLVAVDGWERECSDGPSNLIEVLDVNENKWKRVTRMEHERTTAYHACVVVDKKLYIIGGFDRSKYFNSLYCYDGETGSWSERAPMNFPRCYVAACEHNGTIFAMGGADGGSWRLRTAEMYDAKRNQWTQIRCMTQRRSDAAAAAMGGKIYVCGGYTGAAVLESVEVYTIESDTWTEIAMMNTPRSGLACAVDKDYILIAGGFDGLNRIATVEMLRLNSAHTVNLTSMPTPKSNFSMCKMGDFFYAVGGYNAEVVRNAYRFDGKKWEEICGLSVARSAVTLVLLKEWPNPRALLYTNEQNEETDLDEEE